jgi:hypothetical protein
MARAIGFFSNGLGNWIEAMKGLAALASISDNGKIDICLDENWRDSRRPAVEDICRAWSVIGRVFCWPKEKFNPSDYGLWFYSAHGNNSCGAVSIFLKHTKIVPRPDSWRGSKVHEADHYMDVARGQGYTGDVPKVDFPLAEGPILNLPRPILGICNGWFRTEKMYWQKKGWPHFAKFSSVAGLFFEGSVVGIGQAGELPKEAMLSEDYAGKLNILETAKVISQLDLLVTTDTGPMHLADMLGIPTIALFGPTLTSKNKPRGEKSIVLTSGIHCVPCQDTSAFEGCGKFLCMEEVRTGDVMAAAREKLRSGDTLK